MRSGRRCRPAILIYGQFDRGRARRRARPRVGSPPIRRSACAGRWDPLDPDGTLGLARTKKSLGDVRLPRHRRRRRDRRRRLAGRVHPQLASRTRRASVARVQHARSRPTWPPRCRRSSTAGLAGSIDVGNANTYGGCFGPRFTRIVGTQLGILSRHTWAQALDTNTVAELPGLRAEDGLPDRAHLPQAQLRLGRQLPHPRRHALRVGRRAAQHATSTRRGTAPTCRAPRDRNAPATAGPGGVAGHASVDCSPTIGWALVRATEPPLAFRPGGDSIRDHRRRARRQHRGDVRGPPRGRGHDGRARRRSAAPPICGTASRRRR